MHSVPSGAADEQTYRPDESIDARLQRRMESEDDVDKTGRPAWFTNMSLNALPRDVRGVVLAAGAVLVLLLLAGLFYFALAPSSAEPTSPRATHGWKDIAKPAPTFTTNIGFPGTYKTGAPPEFAQEMPPASKTRGISPIQTGIPGFGAQFNPFRHMGPLSPYYSASFGKVDNAKHLRTPVSTNGTCTLRQVHILHRHGARYPTANAPTSLVRKLLTHGATFKGPLRFLSDYQYRLGEELLVPLGRQQLHLSGVKSAIDYARLADDDAKQNKRLLVRTGSQQRIVDSALAWTTGFFGNDWLNKTDFEVQIEEPRFNTTLAPNFACPAAKDSTERLSEWVEKYLAKATARLQKHAKGVTLTPMMLHGMQQLCSYDTVAFGYSDFCGLFTEEEWLGYEYAWDLRFYYDYGPGASTGPGMGLGWVNEFVSRLTRTKWDPKVQTSENTTLNTDARLFPVDRAIYADFTHDSVLTSVLAALRLKEIDKAPKLEDKHRQFRTSLLVPFSARLIFEKYDCPGPVPASDAPAHQAPTSYMRLKLNDAIVPLEQLSHCNARPDGLCPLDGFLASLAQRNAQGWWAQC